MSWKKLLRSFKYAFRGLAYLVKNERSFKIHILCLLLVIAAVFVFQLSLLETAVLILAAGLVLTVEAINSGIEILLDIIYPEHNGKSKIIKDISAGAVLISAIISAVIGILVFWFHFS